MYRETSPIPVKKVDLPAAGFETWGQEETSHTKGYSKAEAGTQQKQGFLTTVPREVPFYKNTNFSQLNTD